MNGVTIDDLRDDSRLMNLYFGAVEQGTWDSGEMKMLEFFALAERALRIADNPPAFFCACILRDLSLHITGEDEDRGRRRLNRHRYGS